MTWSIPAAIRSRLRLVWWTSTARRPRATEISFCSGCASAAAARGSSTSVVGADSLASRSDCRATYRSPRSSVTSTWYSIAAIERRVSETRRVLVTRTVRPPGRLPLGDAAQHPGPQVQGAPVVDDLAVGEVQRRVLDQQPDQLAVGDVDDRLPRLREAVARLGVRQRPLLEEAVEVRAGDDDRLALLERAAHADVPVGQREHRLVHAQRGVVQADLGQRPRFDRERRPPLGHAPSPISSSRSVTTTSAPCSFRAAACPTRSTPTTKPKAPARPACTPEIASS